MRIISQNGKHDVPYENCVISVEGKHISAEFPQVNNSTTSFFLGEYSTEENAKNVMEILKYAYLCNQRFKYAYNEANDVPFELLEGFHGVFQFPQDSEVDV